MDASFKVWLEASENKGTCFVFSDMDETLVHNMEWGWLKDSKKNREYAKMVVPGKPPYPDVFKINAEGHEYHIFPRPGSTEFVKSVSKFADLYILTHSEKDYAEKVVKQMKWNKYVKGIFSTGEQEPESLGKKFSLQHAKNEKSDGGNKWVLVDNLPMKSVEICNKLRILGLGDPKRKPIEDVHRIQGVADMHFVKVEEWVPTVDEYDDYDLWRALPKIKHKLGLGNLI